MTEIHAAWEVAIDLKDDLQKMGFRVVMTKTFENQFVRNRKRAEIANAAQAVLMVRLHCDAEGGTGFTTYYPDRQGHSEGIKGPNQIVLQETKPIAIAFHQKLDEDLRGILNDNGLKGDEATAVGHKQGALTGSVFSKVPVVLVEMVVLTNPKDESFILNPANRKKLAHSLADATKTALSKGRIMG